MKNEVVSIDGSTELHEAARMGNAEVVKGLLDNGAEMYHLDGNWRVPLHLAAQGGHADVVKELLKRGANTRIRDENGKSAEDLARESGHRAIAELLRKASHPGPERERAS
jgi:ankyrin repeat protein